MGPHGVGTGAPSCDRDPGPGPRPAHDSRHSSSDAGKGSRADGQGKASRAQAPFSAACLGSRWTAPEGRPVSTPLARGPAASRPDSRVRAPERVSSPGSPVKVPAGGCVDTAGPRGTRGPRQLTPQQKPPPLRLPPPARGRPDSSFCTQRDGPHTGFGNPIGGSSGDTAPRLPRCVSSRPNTAARGGALPHQVGRLGKTASEVNFPVLSGECTGAVEEPRAPPGPPTSGKVARAVVWCETRPPPPSASLPSTPSCSGSSAPSVRLAAASQPSPGPRQAARPAAGRASPSPSQTTAAGFADDAQADARRARPVLLTAARPGDAAAGSGPVTQRKAGTREGAEQRGAAASRPGTRDTGHAPLAHREPGATRGPGHGGLRFLGSRSLCRLAARFPRMTVALPARPQQK